MARPQHLFKAEGQLVREIIRGVNPQITEQIKWDPPSPAVELSGDLQPPRQAP
jgi:hypothetical protein